PLTNRRADEYGGNLENRCRFPLEVFRAMRSVWPDDKPLSVRISAHDWAPGGNTPDDAVVIARLFKNAGADLIDVSSGQTTRQAKPIYGRMYQTPFADRIRNEVDIATMAVGAIFEPDHVNSILMAGRADLCALARPHLADPYWTLHAAAQLGYHDMAWPSQYLSGKAQLERNTDGLRMGELSRRLMVTGGNVTGITTALVAEGLVERRAIPGDRRAQLVRLTPVGKRAFDAMAVEHERWVKDMVGGLTAADRERLRALLGKLKTT